MKTPRIIAITIVFLFGCNCFAQEIEFNYIKKATRKETRSATMAQYSSPIDWKPWFIIGPFDNPDRSGMKIVYPPELNKDLAVTYKGRNDELVSWKSARFTGWDPINLKQFSAGRPIVLAERI